MTNDLDTPAAELALGYRDTRRAERAFRTMKTSIQSSPFTAASPAGSPATRTSSSWLTS